jgi:hypothetical protein
VYAAALRGDDGADLGDLVRYLSLGQIPAECGEVDEGDLGQVPHARVHVRRHPQVEHEQRPPDAGLAEQPGRELAHAAGPEHNRITGRKPAQVDVGEVQASPGQGDAFGADRSLGGARLLARRAASIRPVMAGPVVPAARAVSLIWATICSSPTAIESSPHATREQVLGGRAADSDAGQPQDLAGAGPPMGG